MMPNKHLAVLSEECEKIAVTLESRIAGLRREHGEHPDIEQWVKSARKEALDAINMAVIRSKIEIAKGRLFNAK